MNYRKLGRTGLNVSEVSLGSWMTYGGYVEQENAIQTIRTAYDLGINFFDTANVYELGEAERVVGKILQEYPRSSYVLATKVCGKMGDGPNDQGLSRKHIFEQCDASLQRLGLDYIDIYYCHRYDNETPLEETLRALDDLVSQGKVLYVGVSKWTATQMAEAHAIADKYLLDRIVVNQPRYNMFQRDIEEEVIPLGEENGIGQVVFAPLAHGLLAGKYKSVENIPAGSRATTFHVLRKQITEKRIAQVNQLSAIAEQLNITVGQLAIAWVLRQSGVSSALIGASTPEQVKENAASSGIQLSADVLTEIEKIIA